MEDKKIRRSLERGFFDHGWLKTYHTFSFAKYYDPNFMGFRTLRVINEDRVAPNQGFGQHDHKDMEIISIVLEGELAHKDSTGKVSTLKTNQIQIMSAGTGITHSEFNPSKTDQVHFLQIWIIPDTKNLSPRYEQSTMPSATNEWVLIASGSGQQNSLKIFQDVNLWMVSLEKNRAIQTVLFKNRYGWLQMIDGSAIVDKEQLQTGDGMRFDPDRTINITATSDAKVLFFDLN